MIVTSTFELYARAIDTDPSSDVVVERLRRRVGMLERQLELRLDEIADLRRRVAELESLRPQAGEFDAVPRTRTMRALAAPRALARKLRRRPGSGPRSVS